MKEGIVTIIIQFYVSLKQVQFKYDSNKTNTRATNLRNG